MTFISLKNYCLVSRSVLRSRLLFSGRKNSHHIINNGLPFKNRENNSCHKANQKLNTLSKITSFVGTQKRQIIKKTLINPHNTIIPVFFNMYRKSSRYRSKILINIPRTDRKIVVVFIARICGKLTRQKLNYLNFHEIRIVKS